MLKRRAKYHISALLVMCNMVSTNGINHILLLPIPVLIYMVQARSELKPNRLSHLGEEKKKIPVLIYMVQARSELKPNRLSHLGEEKKKNDFAVRSQTAKNDV